MAQFDVAIVGAGPAGSTCAAMCAAAGLKTVLLEREKFPREKVCGDCLNTSCWSILERLGLNQRIEQLPHVRLKAVEFIGISGRRVVVDLPVGQHGELAIKRSIFDDALLTRAGELGAMVCDNTTVTSFANHGRWKLETSSGETIVASLLVGADGRNSSVARLSNLLPRPARERIALQSHLPLPPDFGDRVVLQFLRHGYSGQSPVNENELNVCLVAKPPDINSLKAWAAERFGLSPTHSWRTITPLTRSAISPIQDNLFLIGDAARVVEPFTGEGIYYAMRSGELAADAITKVIRGEDRRSTLRAFGHAYAEMYRGRLWINRLARASVLWPRFGSLLVQAARIEPSILKLLTTKIVKPT